MRPWRLACLMCSDLESVGVGQETQQRVRQLLLHQAAEQ